MARALKAFAPAALAGKRIAIVGGGWAGLAAAIRAVQCGSQVALFEMAPQLGGRARAVDVDGRRLDNGQHILIGAYASTLEAMRAVGVDPMRVLLRMPLRISGPDGRGLHLESGPPVAAFARAVLKRRDWTIGERLRLMLSAGGWAARGFRCDPSTTVAALTARLPLRVRREFIDPLCVAALNTPSGDASASVFLRVLKDALFSGPGSADLLLPMTDLGAAFPVPAGRWLEDAGGEVRLQQRVECVERAERGWRVDGEFFDAVVLAASARESARLVRPIDPNWSARAEALRYEPIVTVYVRSDGGRLPEPMLALPDDAQWPAQFIFDRGRLGGEAGLFAFVISGAAEWVERGAEAAERAVLAQARALLSSHLREPLEIVHSLSEKRATFRCTPGLSRPDAKIAHSLHAAGDYVAGPYPATLEGAVRSGNEAVRDLAF